MDPELLPGSGSVINHSGSATLVFCMESKRRLLFMFDSLQCNITVIEFPIY